MILEAGMYVRTKITDNCNCVYIRKITEIDNGKALINQICIDEDVFDGWGDERIWIDIEDISKASHSLLGNDKEPCLIEPGDYVNGEKVIRIDKDPFIKGQINLWTNTTTSNYWGDISLSPIIEKDIESIVTKEQFEVMQYKVGE